MNKKAFFFSALLAGMMLASCSSSEEGLRTEKTPDTAAQDGKYPVSFSAYADRGVTRAGKEGLMDIDALRAADGGFGVFAYYTDLKKYDQTYVPNFMYNQKVYDANNGSSDANWTYSPVMYWPNESGSDAQSDDEDKVSFFAYAPYAATSSAASGSVSGDATSGITGFSRNSNAGDPLVKYIANFSTANTVDLCWGVCNDPSWAKIQGGSSQAMPTGLPWLDVEHPQTTSQKMKFTFKHALAQLNVQVDADADVTEHADDDNLAATTKIYVRSISFTGIAMKGALNLNNTVANQALWLDYGGTTDLPYGETVTVKDGRRDGREGSSGAEATNETPAGLNPAIIQNDANNPTTGVTTKYQNLFEPAVAAANPGQPTDDEIAAALTNPVYVIPTGEAMTVTIVYDVETVSPNLAGYISDGTTHGSSVENCITKTIYYNGDGLSLESGKKYTIYLHLGMNSVKFDADVDNGDNTIVNTNGWLPSNVAADPGVALASATVGMVIGANGKAYNTIAEANTYSTAAAIIAYKGNGEGNSSYNTGLAISLEDVAGDYQWKSSDDGTCTVQNDDFDIIKSDLNGLAHTETLCSSGHSDHGHDAAVAANGYTSTMPKPANCSTWFLPTIGQWKLIVEAMCGGTGLTTSGQDTYEAANFNKKIRTAYGVSESTTCAGDVEFIYWSSVEDNTDRAWNMNFSNGGANFDRKDDTYYVRPVLAF